MSIKPILFNTDMVRAILDGRKSEKRLVVKAALEYCAMSHAGLVTSNKPIWSADGIIEASNAVVIKPPYLPGDILYVRETWRLVDFDCIDTDWSASVQYKADMAKGERWHDLSPDERIGWRSSTTMPREAARIWLRVTDVRVERLQDMSMDDIRREGAVPSCVMCYYGNLLKDRIACERGIVKAVDCPIESAYPEVGFQALWDSTIKPADRERYGWEANPWVFVIEFERCDKPEEG